MQHPLLLILLCDAITPVLLVCCIGLACHSKPSYRRKIFAALVFTQVSLGLSITYGLMGLDNTIQVWPRYGLDYSTHTAFALSLSLPLLKYHHWAWALLLLAYGAIMNSLAYHTWLDILSTLLAWSALTVPLVSVTNYFFKKTQA